MGKFGGFGREAGVVVVVRIGGREVVHVGGGWSRGKLRSAIVRNSWYNVVGKRKSAHSFHNCFGVLGFSAGKVLSCAAVAIKDFWSAGCKLVRR